MDVAPSKLKPKYPATEGYWKSFQKRWKIKEDDLPGNQTYGAVRALEEAYWVLHAKVAEYDNRVTWPAIILLSVAAFVVGYMFGKL